jgi:hypothetical protein
VIWFLAKSTSDSEAGALQQAQAGAVEQDRHEARHAVHPLRHGTDLFSGEHDGQPSRPLRPHDVVEPGQVLLEDIAIEKEDGAQGLVLGGRGKVLVDHERAQELEDVETTRRIHGGRA